ncbi:MAG: hypothetical protein ACYS6K_04620 [Planctomycetota bacterium]|jgi:hypothetical protein
METKTSASDLAMVGIVLSGLAMSVGWGFRGDYGHEAGAMVPGALLGLSICLASGRQDWWQRATIMAMCGAVGWALGGQMSYGRVIGYTASSSFPDVAYGYASLFLIGGLWAGIGAAILALSVTKSRSYLESFAWPLVTLWLVWFTMGFSGITEWLVDKWSFNDTDWYAALSALLVAGLYTAIIPRHRQACFFIMLIALGWLVVGLCRSVYSNYFLSDLSEKPSSIKSNVLRLFGRWNWFFCWGFFQHAWPCSMGTNRQL